MNILNTDDDKLYNLYLELKPVIAKLEEERVNFRHELFLSFIRRIDILHKIKNNYLKTVLYIILLPIMTIYAIWIIPLIAIVLTMGYGALINLFSPDFIVQLLKEMGLLKSIFIILGYLSLSFFIHAILVFIYKKIKLNIKDICQSYIQKFKNIIIPSILNALYEGKHNLFYNYDTEDNLLKDFFIESKLFPASPDELAIGDTIKAYTQNGEIRIQEIFAFKQILGNKYNRNDASMPVFEGIFAIIPLEKSSFYPIGTSNTFGKNKVLFDNSEFNDVFEVFCDNDKLIEAFLILPSNILERFVNFTKNYNKRLDFSIVKDKLYIAINHDNSFSDSKIIKLFKMLLYLPYSKDLLEPPLFKSLYNYSIYKDFLYTLSFMIGIIEDLKIQTEKIEKIDFVVFDNIENLERQKRKTNKQTAFPLSKSEDNKIFQSINQWSNKLSRKKGLT